jgi:hypothetical protein
VKQIFIALFVILLSSPAKTQGIYTYKPVEIAIKLPADTALSARVERESSYFNLSVFEKDFIYHVNYARKHPDLFKKLAVVPYLAAYPKLNSVYGEGLLQDLSVLKPLPPLKVDSRLFSIARLHAIDLGKHDMMSHQSSDGTTTQQRFEKVGIGCGTECINMGDFPNALEVLLSLLIDYKVINAGHRKSLLNPKMNSIGVGAAKNVSGQLQYTVADLACD